MARITLGFTAGVKTGEKHNSSFKNATAVTDADLVVSYDNTKVTSISQLQSYLADVLAQAQAGQGGLTK